MSVQFGRWNFDGQPPAQDYLEKVSRILALYGPDSDESYSQGGVGILHRAFYTTKESHHESQPLLTESGAFLTWDGRLDNRAELVSELQDSLTIASTDLAIVASAYEKWGTNCLAKLIGDWALSVWNPRSRALLLAKDPIGTRHLYYSVDKDQATWCTLIDPLVLFSGKTFATCEEYIAGWLSTMFPAVHLTPYVGIHTVPPSSFVLLRPGKHNVTKYWDFDPGKKIGYRTDAEYEEHFRSALATAIRRRLRSDRPVLAELSGGMDSSSIVCMADLIFTRGVAENPRLDTISWYDDSLPNWGERLCFTKIEEKRGRTGFHIDTSSAIDVGGQTSSMSAFRNDRFAAAPIPNVPSELFKRQAAHMMSQGHRVTLSGIGGGEVTGDGVPTPTPEFQDLLARARVFTLARQLKAWAAKMRKSRLPLLWEAVREFSPLALLDIPEFVNPVASWLHPGFLRRNRIALRDYPSRVKLFGPLPSFQHNLRGLEVNRRLMARWPLQPELLREVRFPYLDRDLLEFMYAIPREQIVRVGQRRSLMKRALVGIVPDEVLNRKRKALVPQETLKTGSTEWPSLADIGQHIISSSIGIVDLTRFLETLQKAQRDEVVPMRLLTDTILLESWLRHIAIHGVLTNSPSAKRTDSFSLESKELEAPAQNKSLAS